jgi:hypothetical protein
MFPLKYLFLCQFKDPRGQIPLGGLFVRMKKDLQLPMFLTHEVSMSGL